MRTVSSNPTTPAKPLAGRSMAKAWVVFFAATVAMVGVGCSPNNRQVKFYLLQPVSRPDAHGGLVETAKPLLVGVGPVEIPAYLDRPQIVTGNAGAELQMAEYHRWAEPLKDSITRVLAENLALSMPDSHIVSFPWNRAIALDFQVEVKVSRFHVDAAGHCELKADWTLLKQNKPVLMKAFQTITFVTGNDFAADVVAQSQALARFGKEIAAGLQAAAETR